MLLIPSLKHITKHIPIATLADPIDLYIPLAAYNSQMTPCVSIGERVQKYQLLAESTGIFASKIHAPVSGTIVAFFQLNGKAMIHLQNDFLALEYPISPPSIEDISQSEFIDLLRDAGIQGAGGSQFPTQLKYSIENHKIHTLIFNGAECEPYLSADISLLRAHCMELLQMAKFLQKLIQVPRLVLAIERQHQQLKKLIQEGAETLTLQIDIKILPDAYPQGGELQLIKSVTGNTLKKGSIPANYGILVSNIGTLWAMYKAVFEGKPNIERVVTVSGNSCSNLGNYLVKIGTPVLHILRETQNSWDLDRQMIILGGAMMGKAVASPLVPIHKGSGGLLVMEKQNIDRNNCIKCGLCVDVCPQKLMPLELVRFNLAHKLEELKNEHLNDCIECGACAYVCPSDVPLMENIFDGKAKLLSVTSHN